VEKDYIESERFRQWHHAPTAAGFCDNDVTTIVTDCCCLAATTSSYLVYCAGKYLQHKRVGFLAILDQIFDVRRNHLQILSDILSFCKTPQPKTHILYRSNTNSKLLENYLTQLQVSRLLELSQETKRYITTPKGTEFVETWLKLQEMINPQKNLVVIRARKAPADKKQQLTAIPVINKKWAEP